MIYVLARLAFHSTLRTARQTIVQLAHQNQSSHANIWSVAFVCITLYVLYHKIAPPLARRRTYVLFECIPIQSCRTGTGFSVDFYIRNVGTQHAMGRLFHPLLSLLLVHATLRYATLRYYARLGMSRWLAGCVWND
jgi:hypothetical protein